MEIIILKQQGHVKNKVEIKFFVPWLTYSKSSLNVEALWQGGDDDSGGGDVAALPPLPPTEEVCLLPVVKIPWSK